MPKHLHYTAKSKAKPMQSPPEHVSPTNSAPIGHCLVTPATRSLSNSSFLPMELEEELVTGEGLDEDHDSWHGSMNDTPTKDIHLAQLKVLLKHTPLLPFQGDNILEELITTGGYPLFQQEQTKSLLQQVLDQDLCADNVIEGARPVPECILLHGDFHEVQDLAPSKVDEILGGLEEEIEEAPHNPQDIRRVHASIGDWDERTCYLQAIDRMQVHPLLCGDFY
ncbi:hypothetical protein RhiXN_09496 [Rhizoctonia solani]|uniref:Uncharacterized protein n=1 Tax=Rhizoctonia solani TaxID=456999 RepID=A0A8H8SXV6_9AGAM|nr:uncharacterized protein RhiXN_09496 [Rhizoctonia solani]QRW21909.1 hypothetical protein RhiXN_09496 [Rhizoctonia solani]